MEQIIFSMQKWHLKAACQKKTLYIAQAVVVEKSDSAYLAANTNVCSSNGEGKEEWEFQHKQSDYTTA